MFTHTMNRNSKTIAKSEKQHDKQLNKVTKCNQTKCPEIYKEKENAPLKKLVTVKGDIEQDKVEKEEKYNKKIVELIRNIEKDKLRVRELKEFYNEENKKELVTILTLLVNKNVIQGLKYNNEKIFLEKKEIGEKVGLIETPHEKLRDKILQVYELDIKYKAIQLFIEKYCKRVLWLNNGKIEQGLPSEICAKYKNNI